MPAQAEARQKAEMFEQVDMAAIWKAYAETVEKHLVKNRRARVESRDPKKAKFYG